jgi:hypothetical protein
MRVSAKLGLAALAAALLLSAAVSTASAGRLSVSNQNLRVTWSRLEFQAPSRSVTVRCQVTLEGSFHSRTITKTPGTLIGALTRINVKTETCTGGRAQPSRPAPWHVTYEGFTGTLPNITSVRLLLARFQFDIIAIGVTCRMGTATDNVTGSAALNATGEVTSLAPVGGRNTANLLEGPGGGEFFGCPSSGVLVGTEGVVTVLNSTTRIRVTLI